MNLTVPPINLPSASPSTLAMMNVTLPPTDLPSASPSTLMSPRFTCDELGPAYPDFPYGCYPVYFDPYGVDNRLMDELGLTDDGNEEQFWPLFLCKDSDLIDGIPNTEQCDTFCALVYDSIDGRKFCTSCSLVGTELVYDCRNLLPPKDIPSAFDETAVQAYASRNSEGVCGDFVHWNCDPQGFGYVCYSENWEWFLDSPVFPFDEISSVIVTLYCTSDISGLPVTACEQPKCEIARANPAGVCSCTPLFDKNDRESPFDFAYSCFTSAFSNMTCPILDETGTCQDAVSLEDVVNSNAIGIKFPEDDIKDDGQSWTIVNMDPTAFNVLSDIIGYVTRVLLGLVLGIFFPVLVSWQMKRKPVPIDALWPAPGDFLHAVTYIREFSWSFQALLIVVLLFLADFCHTFADAGFDLVVRKEPGEMQPILKISDGIDDRNMERLFRSAGDPAILRTVASKVAFEEGRTNESREQTALANSFLDAAILIARGSSPFVLQAFRPWREDVDFGGIKFDAWFMPDNSPLSVLNKEIPLDCVSTEYAAIEELIYGFVSIDSPMYNTALVPNCTFNDVRASGIYNRTSTYAEIFEHVEFSGISYETLGGADTGKGILLHKANETFQSFSLEPSQKLLARDREDWKSGRTVDAFDGLSIGNVSLNLGQVVFATGAARGDDIIPGSSGTASVAFVSQVTSTCPDRPSGQPIADAKCLAIVEATCEEFEEDSAEKYHETYYPFTTTSQCELSRLSFVWGRNFVVDEELTSVIAGIYGMTRPDAFELLQSITFDRHAILSALFLTGTIEERPAVESIVRAQVNLLYVVMMVLPVILAVLLISLSWLARKNTVPLPQSSWDMMVLGQESFPMTVPRRASQSSPFPKPPKHLALSLESVSEKRVPMVSLSQMPKRDARSGKTSINSGNGPPSNYLEYSEEESKVNSQSAQTPSNTEKGLLSSSNKETSKMNSLPEKTPSNAEKNSSKEKSLFFL